VLHRQYVWATVTQAIRQINIDTENVALTKLPVSVVERWPI